MVIFLQFFDFLDLLFCFAFVDMIEVEYIFLLTHYIIGLHNIRTVQFLMQHYL